RGSRGGGPAHDHPLRAGAHPPGGERDPDHPLDLVRTAMIQVPDQRRGRPQPWVASAERARGWLERALWPHCRLRQDLRVIHILYTVCGDHTTSSPNGQEDFSTPQALAGRGKLLFAPRGPVHDLAGRRLRPLRQSFGRHWNGWGIRRHATFLRTPVTASPGAGDSRPTRTAVTVAQWGGTLRRDVGHARRRRTKGMGRAAELHSDRKSV